MSLDAQYDVVIVGARCAGASLATFLARSGADVLLLDRDPLPSDQVLSTHTIHPPGVDVLDDLGVGDTVREVTPRSPTARLRKGPVWADATFADGRDELCPRRERLDGLLQRAATDAGAELRDRTRVEKLLFDEDGRAVGVEIESSGSRERLRAGIVVGADGRRSTVAEQVGAPKYLAYEAPRAMYWAYWDAPPAWKSDAYPFDMYLGHVGEYIRVVFQTDHDQLLVGCLPPATEAVSWRVDPLGSLQANLARDSVTGPLLEGADPSSKVRGTIKEQYYFRQGAGKGWALVGDAGHHKDFVVGDGITEALIQAKNLAAALQEGTDAALERWWRARDVRALPGYFWARSEGALGAPAQLQGLVLARVSRDEGLKRRMTRLPEHLATPFDVLPMSTIVSCLLAGLVRGRFGVLPEFLAQGKVASEYRKELARRQELLAQVDGASAATNA